MSWKVPGWAAVAGAVVSAAAGLAGGNRFGTILLRAVVSALVAGALGLAVQYLLRRFLPDLGAREAPPAVDILIDEEVPLAAQAPGAEPQAEPLEQGPEEVEPFPDLSAPSAPSEPSVSAADGEAAAPALPELEESGAELEGAELEPAGDALEALSAAEAEELPADVGEPALPSRRSLKAEELEAQLDNVTKGQDAAELAKAVRTFMRRDQEG